MPTFKRFEEIDAWSKARELSKDIHSIFKKPGLQKEYVLENQMKKAALSVMANIVEGHERDGNREFIQFLSIAKASSGELRSHLYTALDVKLITDTEFRELYSKADVTGKQIGSLINYLRGSNYKGSKFV